MNDNRHDEAEPSAGADDRAHIAPEADARAPRLASRRYMLLKGVTRGAAILAAATPIKTLASIPSVTADGMLCTVSGIESGVISARTNLSTCGGKSPGYYKKITHWPGYSKSNQNPTYIVGSKKFDATTSFFTVFGGGSPNSLLKIMQTDSSSDEFHWIPALLNAIVAKRGIYIFPYSPQEVLDLYASSSQHNNALAFFKDFMETI